MFHDPPPPDDYVDVEILPVRYGKVCCACQRLLPLKKFEHKITPKRARDLGYKAEHTVRQEWKECVECTKDRGVAPKPPSKLTREEIIRETDKGRLPERMLKANIKAAMARASVAKSFAVGERHSRDWAKPFQHALAQVTAEMHRVRMLRQYNERPATSEPDIVSFCDHYLTVLYALRGHLRVVKRSEVGRADRARINYLAQRKSEHYQTNTRSSKPRGRPPRKVDNLPAWENVCLPDSVWAHYMPPGTIDYLREMFNDIPLRLRVKRMRVIPLLLDPERERPLRDFTTISDDLRDRLDTLSAAVR